MSRSRLAVSMLGISAIFICTFFLAAGWFLLAEEPAPAQEQSNEMKVKPPQRAVLRVAASVLESRLIYKGNPEYPAQAKRGGIEGTVKLTITVNEEGLVYEIKADPENNPILEKAAIAAVKKWKYNPILLNGMPAPVVATIAIAFPSKDTPAPDNATAASKTKASQRKPKAPVDLGPRSFLYHKVEPVYPEEARKAGVQGKVILSIIINEEGFVGDVRVVSGHPLLDAAAIAAVKQRRYRPTVLNGEPVPVQETVTIPFTLK
jgi:TonB family protein